MRPARRRRLRLAAAAAVGGAIIVPVVAGAGGPVSPAPPATTTTLLPAEVRLVGPPAPAIDDRPAAVEVSRSRPRPLPAPTTSPPAGVRVRVTCYGPPQFPAGRRTATGTPVGPGSMATDPRLIPAGSIVDLDGLGRFTADDTGGAVHGRHVDIWRPSCVGWPNPTVTATILR